MGVAWSPDGKRLASCGTDLLAITWDTETGRKLATMRDHHSWVEAVAWSPDGTRLASAGMDNSVRISNPQTGHETYVLRGQSGMFHAVSWHPNGARVAAASSDGRIWIWDATRGYERDRTPRALPYIDRAVASGTARREDLRWFAESYLRSGKPAEAFALVKDDPSGLRQLAPRLAAAYHDCGDEQASAEVLKRYPEAAAGIGDRYAAEKDWARAIAEYSKVITDQAADGNMLVKRATAYEAVGQRDLAAADWLRAARRYADLAQELAPAVLGRANSLVNAGVSAFESGRRADAIRDLKQARDLLRILNRALPEHGKVASGLSISLGFLGSALRDENRPTEALEAHQDARQVLEAIRRPTSLDLYNLACVYANLSTLGEFGTIPSTSAERDALADRAMDALRRSLAASVANFNMMDRDHDLDPLRNRPDFRALMLDRDFPADPFAR
jgi:tetratricopeptide (TPR) repeat protein